VTTETVLGLLFAAVVALFALGFVYAAHRLYRLRRYGVWTVAEVVRFREDEDSDGRPRYFPVVIFTLPDGSEIEAESDTPVFHLLSGVSEGSRIHVVYDPAAPSHVSQTKGTTAKELRTLLVLAAVLAFVSLWIALDVLT
jgi:hypothetical protein